MKKKQYGNGRSEKVPTFNYEIGRDSAYQPGELKGRSDSILESRKKLLKRTGGKPKNMMSEFYF